MILGFNFFFAYIVYKHQRKDSIYICTKEEIHDDEIRVYWYLIFFSVHKKEIQDDEIGVYWYLFFFVFFLYIRKRYKMMKLVFIGTCSVSSALVSAFTKER